MLQLNIQSSPFSLKGNDQGPFCAVSSWPCDCRSCPRGQGDVQHRELASGKPVPRECTGQAVLPGLFLLL